MKTKKPENTKSKKLTVKRETLRTLTPAQLVRVPGGAEEEDQAWPTTTTGCGPACISHQ